LFEKPVSLCEKNRLFFERKFHIEISGVLVIFYKNEHIVQKNALRFLKREIVFAKMINFSSFSPLIDAYRHEIYYL